MATSKKSSSARGSRPGISRIDQESTRTHGFFARFGYQRDKQGTWRPRHRAFFGDASHGGKRKALAAAEAWLGKVERAERRAAKTTTVKKAAKKKSTSKKTVARKTTAKKAASRRTTTRTAKKK
ncbi:MAG TPA: hypothetical protein VFG84_11100 [Gemmatimonadaceae bacterium]|nr:hypothetical protein [Gemmatimonadaceae bacterium]